MNFIRLVPNVYYQDIHDGLKFFVDCLEFKIGHEELKPTRFVYSKETACRSFFSSMHNSRKSTIPNSGFKQKASMMCTKKLAHHTRNFSTLTSVKSPFARGVQKNSRYAITRCASLFSSGKAERESLLHSCIPPGKFLLTTVK